MVHITEATVRHTFETFRKLYSIDIYLELGAYAWRGTLNTRQTPGSDWLGLISRSLAA